MFCMSVLCELPRWKLPFLVLARFCLNVARLLQVGCSSLVVPSHLELGESFTIMRSLWPSSGMIVQWNGTQHASSCGKWCPVSARLRCEWSRALVPGAGCMRLEGLKKGVLANGHHIWTGVWAVQLESRLYDVRAILWLSWISVSFKLTAGLQGPKKGVVVYRHWFWNSVRAVLLDS